MPAPRARIGGSTDPTTETRRRAPLVLVVDDADDTRELYADYFGLSGFRTAIATNGAEALEKAFSLVPDLILLDLGLPIVDGWEAARRIRANDVTRDLPIIAVSGFASEAHVNAAREAGCDEFVAKPALPQVLLERARALLHSA